MMEKGVTTRSRMTTNSMENDQEVMQSSRSSSPSCCTRGEDSTEASLKNILSELREFRKDSKEQLSDIKNELKRANTRLDEAEGRIEEAENAIQASSTLINRLLQRQTNLEAKLLDQEGRARRENLRIYGVPEGKEGADMIHFLDNFLKNALDLPADQDLGIERAHRVPALKPSDPNTKPRSIVIKFGRYRTKEEVLRRAWQKKGLLLDNTRIYVDHDFPPEVMRKRSEYAEAKKVLKSQNIKFQTPYPAKMRIFYADGPRLFQDASEATKDMASRGFEVNLVKSIADPDREEIQLLSTWQRARRRQDRSGDAELGAAADSTQFKKGQRSQYKEKLKEFRRQPSTVEN